MISQKQVKLFQYLYMEEDLTILGAYEVYLKTNELQDFIENLVIIDKYHYFKTRLVSIYLFCPFSLIFVKNLFRILMKLNNSIKTSKPSLKSSSCTRNT